MFGFLRFSVAACGSRRVRFFVIFQLNSPLNMIEQLLLFTGRRLLWFSFKMAQKLGNSYQTSETNLMLFVSPLLQILNNICPKIALLIATTIITTKQIGLYENQYNTRNLFSAIESGIQEI